MPMERALADSVPPELRRYLEVGTSSGAGLSVFLLAGRVMRFMHSHGIDDEFHSLWQAHRDEILPAWIREYPGSRPFGWWMLEAPEPRRVLRRDPTTTCAVVCRAFGVELMPPDIRCVIESQAEFLRRTQRLSRQEATALKPAAFKPVTLEANECEEQPGEEQI